MPVNEKLRDGWRGRRWHLGPAMLLGSLSMGVVLASTAATSQRSAQLIARELLLGNPARSAAAVSPDGTRIAFLAPNNGVMNVWVAPITEMDQARVITGATGRPIAAYYWAPDSRQILYFQDHDGDENDQLFGVSLTSGRTVNYTPFPKTTATIVAMSPLRPEFILIAVNRRDPLWPDVYQLALGTGDLKLIWTNDGMYRRVIADRSLKLRLGEKTSSEGGYQVDRFLDDGSVSKSFVVEFSDSQTTTVVDAAANAAEAYLLDSRGRDTAALEIMDLGTGAIHVLGADPRVDIASNSDGGVGGEHTLIQDPRTAQVLAYSVNDLKLKWIPVGNVLKASIAFLDRRTRGQWRIASQSDDNRLWTVAVDRPNEPTSYFLFDRQRLVLEKLFSERPQLDGRGLSSMRALEIRARDGTRLVSYLSLPVGTETGSNGRLKRRLPAVVVVHGGPDERNVYGYDRYHQWLTSRGYAVLSVNYRGSTGFGKAFTNSRAWSPQVSEDILDGVNWLIAQGFANPDRIAIMGGSYGGYAALAGLATSPTAYACGVDSFGPTDLVDLLAKNSVLPDWSANYERLVRIFGDPRTEEGRSYLRERSPRTHADRVTRPLLVAQGANDPRVRKTQSDLFVDAVKLGDPETTYAVFPDEGHGFLRMANTLAFAAVAEVFLHGCVGGVFEPLGKALHDSSIEIPVGADRIPGLAAALRIR
jgi:dipeptidyl aminopeptidase/acylaminoacyl peptidase